MWKKQVEQLDEQKETREQGDIFTHLLQRRETTFRTGNVSESEPGIKTHAHKKN